ncbi:MAG: hypothetical protein MUC59_10805 [Saprospiraceae bacterium]|nr:hypothetical protein [Saprospiraceae bacterium]
MFDKIKQTINTAGESLKEQATSISEAAKEKWLSIIETWISTLPKLEAYGLKTTYFGISMSLNPALEIELQSQSKAFPIGRVEAILAENPGSSPVNIVFTAVKTAIKLHDTARIEKLDPMSVRIMVRLSPEVKVGFGEHKIA